MRKQMGVGLRTWVLGATATGLLSLPVLGQSSGVPGTTANKPETNPAPLQIQPPQLLAVPTEIESAGSGVITASQIEQVEIAANEKSEVERQLELLYEKDGREMPDLKMNLQPLTSTKTPPATSTAPASGQGAPAAMQKQAKPAPGYMKYQPAARPLTPTTVTPTTVAPVSSQPPKNYANAISAQKQGQPQSQAAAQPAHPTTQNRITGFFKRFVPGKKANTSTPPIPPDYANGVPDVPLASSAPGAPAMLPSSKGPAIPLTPTVQIPSRPQLSQVPLQSAPMPLVPQTPIAVGFNVATEPALTTFALPQLAQQPLPLASTGGPEILPPLLTEPDAPALVANSDSSDRDLPNPSKDPMEDFPDPFSDGNDVPALSDKPTVNITNVQPVQTAPAQEVALPDDDNEAIKIPEMEEDPFAVRAKNFAEPAFEEKSDAAHLAAVPRLGTPEPTEAPKALSVPRTTDAPAAIKSAPPAPPMPELSGPALDVGALKPAEVVEDAHIEKMKRIRERFGMKGLKGFCPVTLRDERELLDAKPEYFFTHRGQKFHFASAEARAKFEQDPSLYAPAAYGADVVALGRDKDVVEGTLDFAAWFKGRLYLFGSQANYDVFVKSPVTYASPAGVE